jgi:hypothetical protein
MGSRKRVRSGNDPVLSSVSDNSDSSDSSDSCDDTRDSTSTIPKHILLPTEMLIDDDDCEYLEYMAPQANSSATNLKNKSQRHSKAFESNSPLSNYNLITDRLVGTLHMPLQIPKMGKEKKDTRMKCGICGAKTTIQCSHCGVGMCIADRGGMNCWKEFHTREFIEYARPKLSTSERKNADYKSVDNGNAVDVVSLLPIDHLEDIVCHPLASSENHREPQPDANSGDLMDSIIV